MILTPATSMEDCKSTTSCLWCGRRQIKNGHLSPMRFDSEITILRKSWIDLTTPSRAKTTSSLRDFRRSLLVNRSKLTSTLEECPNEQFRTDSISSVCLSTTRIHHSLRISFPRFEREQSLLLSPSRQTTSLLKVILRTSASDISLEHLGEQTW